MFIFVESAQENVSGKKHFGITPEILDKPNFEYVKIYWIFISLFYVFPAMDSLLVTIMLQDIDLDPIFIIPRTSGLQAGQ